MRNILLAVSFMFPSSMVMAQVTEVNQAIIDSISDESVVSLDDIVVVAQKPLVKMEADKLTYNVETDNDSKSGTLLDMLRKVPMVTVDGQDNITVNGSSSFKVYVNGKPDAMFSGNPSAILKSMPASSAKKIEVITNPSARYDADGAGGILNIVMDKKVATSVSEGYDGSLRLSAGNKNLGGGAFVYGQKGKFSYNANVVENYSMPGTVDVYIERLHENGSSLISDIAVKNKVPFLMGNFNAAYEIDTLSSVNVVISLRDMKLKNDGRVYTSMFDGSNSMDYSYGIAQDYGNTSFCGSVDYQRFLTRDRSRSMTLTYQLTNLPSEGRYDNHSYDENALALGMKDNYSLNEENTIENILQADYTMRFGDAGTLNAGGKFSVRDVTSTSAYYLKDTPDKKTNMDYGCKDYILAWYAEYGTKIKNLSMKGGMRYEHTWQDIRSDVGNVMRNNKDYGIVIPSASLSYAFTVTSNLGLNYNMRISRPGISYLNPYINHTSSTWISYGNADLETEKSHNVSLVYNLFKSRFMMNTSLCYSYTDNGIEKYDFIDDGILNTTYGNIVVKNKIVLKAYLNWLMADKTRLILNVGLSYTDLHSGILSADNCGWHGDATVGLQQTLSCGLNLSSYLILATKEYGVQGWNSGYDMLTLNMSKSFFNDRLDIGLTGLVGLNSGGKLKIENFDCYAGGVNRTKVNVPLAGLTFSVTYKFGNSKRKVKQHVSKVKSNYVEKKQQGDMFVGDGIR